MKYVPTFSLSVETPDFFEGNGDRSNFLVAANAKWPLWQGLDRHRNVLRQKKIMRQLAAEGEMSEAELNMKWQKAQKKLMGAEMDLKLARASEELARLRMRQREIRYKSNQELLSGLLESRMAYKRAQKKTLAKTREYQFAELQIRYLSGDLLNRYVSVQGWKE